MDIVLEVLKLGSVGLIAGLFSSYLANRDYRNRKWWELRVGAYQSAIESLSDLIYYYDRHYSAEIEQRKLPEESKKKLNEYWESGFHKIRKSADSGAFLFSPGANAALGEFMNLNDEQDDSYFEYLDRRLAGAKKCLVTLVECSKTDLKLKPSLLERFL
jgi:hypothetical protein